MTEECKKQIIENKRRFIRELGELCYKRNVNNVVFMNYDYDEKTIEETVAVYFIGGGETVVNVTADSLSAMVRDIFKVI